MEGNSVALTIPAVDTERGDSRNILGVIVQYDQIKNNNRTGMKSGLLKDLFSSIDFDVCNQRLLTIRDVKKNTEVSLRTTASSESDYGEQGFHKCTCGPNQCKTNRCKCLKGKLRCSSRCHVNFS